MLTATLLLAAGCGDDDGQPATGKAGPLTPRAIAAVMLDHLPDDTTRREATYIDEDSPKGLVGASFRYRGDGEYDGDLVEVTVRPGPLSPCDGNCVDLGDGMTLHWDELAPEEDPGIVVVTRQHDGEVVGALMNGPSITGDPRDLDLEPSVETLTKLVQDPRLQLQADGETLAAGEELSDWDGGEIDPATLEKVPNNDATIVTGWIWGYGDGWQYVGPSPYKKDFGKDAIGGRVRITGDMQIMRSGFVDALAAPQPPPWLESGCLEGYRCETFRGVRLVWRPASGDDPGDAFVVHVRRGGETVAFHTVGNRLPDSVGGAAGPAGLWFWGPDLTQTEYNELEISLTTTREKFEAAAERADQSRSKGSE